VEAQQEAVTAEATADAAATEALEAREEVDDLRAHIAGGFAELRNFITETMTPKPPSEEPTEVVVTHGTTNRPDTGETGANAGSGESASGDERPYRHRFGRRRT
jgi:hypothetical protein